MFEKLWRPLLIVALVVALGASVVWIRDTFFTCHLNGKQVCMVDDVFGLEPNAQIKVAVPNEELADALSSLWQQQETELADRVTFVVDADTTKDPAQTTYDLMLLDHVSATLYRDSLRTLDGRIKDQLLLDETQRTMASVNKASLVWVPQTLSGWMMVYDRTQLLDMGVDLTDRDANDVPDVLETWEQLALLQTRLGDDVSLISLNYQDAQFTNALLSAGGWQYFPEFDVRQPGFDTERFTSGLTFVQSLRQFSPIARPGETGLRFESDFYSGTTPISFIAPWMSLAEEYATQGKDIHYAPFPKNGTQALSPLADGVGWVINNQTNYPSAAHRVLAFLRNQTVLTRWSELTNEPVLLSSSINLDVTEEMREKIQAISHQVVLAHLAYDDQPDLDVARIYKDVDLRPYVRALVDGDTSVSEAQTDIIEQYHQWLKIVVQKESSHASE